MRLTSISFDVVKATAPYTCKCRVCGKTLSRKASAEQTINPFNTNEDGSVKSGREVRRDAQAAADVLAAVRQDVDDICRDCEDAPNRLLLLSMAAHPDTPVAEPERYWGSPLHVLEDRKHVERRHMRCDCGSNCCSGYKRNAGFVITRKGLERAGKLREKATS